MTEQHKQPVIIPIPFEKRFFDIIFSTIFLILLLPLFMLIIILMLSEMVLSPAARGSFFYSETRISQGKPFIIRKFRIFKKEALEKAKKSNGVIHTKDLEHTSGATTKVGKLLKQIYMDELPQLYNVFMGEMSLVGPRPTNTENSEKLLQEHHLAKFILKAGMTGYFQSHKGISLSKTQDELDMEYAELIKNNPGWKVVLYDIKILFISILTILRAEGV